MRSPAFIVGVILLLLGAVGIARDRAAPRLVEHAAPARQSRHAAPPADVASLNAAGERRLPRPLHPLALAGDRPAVIVFLKADCGCSEDFGRMLESLAPHLAPRASCLVVLEAESGKGGPFVESTGLTVPYLVQPDSDLAAAWGVTKAGCVALVDRDGLVEAVWPGISRQGFRDLASRLGDPELFPGESLAMLPGAATAGCPLRPASPDTSTGTTR